MARRLTIDSGASDFVRREARDVYKRLRDVRGAVSQSGDPGLSSLKRPIDDVAKVMKRWSEDGTKTADDMKQIAYTFHNKILPNLTNLDSVIKNGTQTINNLFKQIGGSNGLGSVVPTNGAVLPGAGAGGGGEGGGILSAVGGLLGGVTMGALALGVGGGLAGITTTLELARAQQEVEEQMAYRGTRMGRVGQFNTLSRDIAGKGLMSYSDASQFALGVGNIGGVKNFSEFSKYTNEAAMFTRMLGLTNEQGMQTTGELRRMGVNSNQLREFGEIIGKAAGEQGIRGREGEILKALTDNLSQISNLLMIPASGSGAFSATAARFITGIEGQFKGIPGMSGAPGVGALMQPFSAIQGNNPFTSALGNISQPFIGMGLLNATHGNMGAAMVLAMRANPGQPQSWKALADIIGSMQNTMGGSGASPTSIQGAIQSQFGMQMFNRYLTPQQLGTVSGTIQNMSSHGFSDKQIEAALAKQGVTMQHDVMADLSKSLTKEINVLTNLTSAIGAAGFPLLTDAIHIFSDIAKAWMKILPAIDKGANAVAGVADDVSKRGVVPVASDAISAHKWAGALGISGTIIGSVGGPVTAGVGAALGIEAGKDIDSKGFSGFLADLSKVVDAYITKYPAPGPWNNPTPTSAPTGKVRR